MEDKLEKGYGVVIEDIIENVFITLALAFFFESKVPTLKKAIIITMVTVFYWIVIYKFLRPLYS
jgi:hypothetical protein|tara:strand:+ start:186 stop:377 length:192 start_codon:yes stop_codon:yes gene_type:complete